MKTLRYTTILAVMLPAIAFAATDAQTFVQQASSSDMFEIQSSKLALQKSKNAEVKSIANQLINDHSKSTANLKATLAKSKSDAKPATALAPKHQKMLDELKEAKTDDFDAAYLDAQEDAHEEAVSLFTAYSKGGDDAALKDFAAKTLPTLEKHKEHVEKLDDKDVGDNL